MPLALLAGCVTPYQPDNGSGGYREQRVDASTWFVAFRGASETKIDDVFIYWLYRCAEITQREGYTHFVRVDRKSAGLEPAHRIGSGRWSAPAGGGFATAVPVKGGSMIFVPMYQGPAQPDPEVAGLVKLMREVPEAQKGFAYEAAQILRDHAARVGGRGEASRSTGAAPR